MALSAPITRSDHAVLRAAVIAAKEATPRGRVPEVLHVGVSPTAAARHAVVSGQLLDHALRTDLCAALLQRTDTESPRWAWLTRDGALSLHDADVAWSAAWHAACAEREVDVPFVVVTRWGWRDPRSGVRREWSRLRRRSGTPAG